MNRTNIFRQNEFSLAPLFAHKQNMSRHTKTCWKCQKDKHTKGGRLIIKMGLFVCKDCEDAKLEKATERPTRGSNN